MNEYKMSSADITIRCDATVDDLIDVIEARSRSYIPVIYVLNKIDAISIEELDLLYRIPNAVPISSEQGWNIDELMEAMYVHSLPHTRPWIQKLIFTGGRNSSSCESTRSQRGRCQIMTRQWCCDRQDARWKTS